MMLRTFEVSDLAAVRELIHRTIVECYPSAYPPHAVAYFKRFHSDDAVLARARDGSVVVIEDAGAILATGAVVGSDVSAVFVAPERQREGLGGTMMDELEGHAVRSGHSSVSLSVSLPSRSFYEQRGYRVIEACSIDVGEEQRLEYWQAVKDLAGGS